MIQWLDLLIEGDPHPRRFDTPKTIRSYLTHIERLSDEAVTELLRNGVVGPPAARREYRIQKQLTPATITDSDIELSDTEEGPVVAIPVYAGVSELELSLMVSVCRLCGGEHAIRTVNRSRASIVTAGGLVMTPHVLYAALPEPAAILIPGGPGSQKASRDPLLKQFLKNQTHLPTGVSGSGLLLLGEAECLKERQIGGPVDLADTLWGFQPNDIQPGQVVRDRSLMSTPSGLPALQAAFFVATALWGDAAVMEAARSLGQTGY